MSQLLVALIGWKVQLVKAEGKEIKKVVVFMACCSICQVALNHLNIYQV